MKDRLAWYVVAIATIVLNYWAFYGIASLFGSKIPHFIAISLTVSMFVHELGHLIVMEANGVPSMMVFLVLLGGAGPLPRGRERDKNLNWGNQAAIMLAGVAGNLAIILAVGLFWSLGYVSADTCLRTWNLNAILIMWNLFPLWKLDGGHFTQLLFDSIDENRDTKYEMGLSAAFFAILIMVLVICGKFNLFNFWLFFWGLHYKANHDDRPGSQNIKKIPLQSQKWWAILYLVMIGIGVVILSSTPVWLANPKP